MASSWLDRVVANNLVDALAWRKSKQQVKTEPGTEPKQHPLYTDNGSSLKVRVAMPSAVLQVLKVQGQAFTLTDGVVSIQARVANSAGQEFENHHSSPISSIKNKSIIVTSCDITATHLGPPVSRIQLIILGLNISPAPLDLSDVSTITPIHQFSVVRDVLQQLHQLSNPPTERAAPTPTSVPAEQRMDVEMIEAPSSAEKVNSMKRPHSPPNRASSHRLVRPRIHEGDDEVMIQKGVNLHQPVQASTNSSHQSDLLRNLLSRQRLPVAGRASESTAIEQALRLGTGMSAQMGPPPVPADKNNDDRAQKRLPQPSQSQSLSQDFRSQIPMPEPAAPEPVGTENVSRKREDADSNIPKVGLPNSTPTSAQPEPVEATQSSLPQGNLPPPSQPAQDPPASMSTSSSHLLEEPSSSVPRPLYRAPSPMLIKYASRPMPENQRRLLDKPTSWWPPRPGTTFPHPNLPIEIIQEMEEYAEQRAARKKAKAPEKELEEEKEREGDEESERLANAPVPTQGTQSSALPWSSSPPHPPLDPPRHRMQTQRRSTNLAMPLPPDSSAEDPMQVDESEDIPSSPPSGSVSDDNDASDAGDLLEITPKLNPRQLPEYPLSSPGESSSGQHPELGPDDSQPKRNIQESIKFEYQEQTARKYSPILDEVIASPQVQVDRLVPEDREQVSELIDSEDDVIMDDEPQLENDNTMDEQLQLEDDETMDNPPQANTRQIMEHKTQVQVAASPQSQPKLQLRRRRRSWGLEEFAETETLEEKQARHRREFMERLRQGQQTDPETTPVPKAEPQPKDEIQKEPEMPAPDTQAKSDLMEVEEPLVDSTRSADPTVAKRASIIEEWRQMSDQQEGFTRAVAPNSVVSESIVSEQTAGEPMPEPVLSKPVVPEPIVAESFGSGTVVPASPGHGIAPSDNVVSESVDFDLTVMGSKVQNTSRSEPLASDRMQSAYQPTEPDLVPSLKYGQAPRAEARLQAEQQRPAPFTRPPKPPTYKSQQEASSDVRQRNRKDIEKGKFGSPTRALWVGSLPADMKDKQVREMFAEFDPVLVAAKTKSAFVNFADIETACKALETVRGSIFHNREIVCKFTAPREYREYYIANPVVSRDSLLPPRPPAHDPQPTTGTNRSRQDNTMSPSLTIEDLFHEFSKKRKFKGNRKAFENLCKKLHDGSASISTAQWDNYVALQPAQYLPYVNRSVANGETFENYDTYWRRHLQTTQPDLIPVLTPDKLEAAFNHVSGPHTPASRPNVPVSPQTVSGTSRPRQSSIQRTPTAVPASTSRTAPVAEDLRRSVVERNAQSVISRPQSATPNAAKSILDMPEPDRVSLWLKHTVVRDPKSKIVQSDLYGMYKKTFQAGMVQLLNGQVFTDHLLATLKPLKSTKVADGKGGFTFYFDGIRFIKSARPTPASASSDVNTPGFRIKGASASSPGETTDRSEHFTSSGNSTRRERGRSSLGERDESPRRSLPFAEESPRPRPRSPPHNPSSNKGVSKGKPSPAGHLSTREDLGEDSKSPEYRKFVKNYRSLGNVTKRGNAFSERE